MNWKKYSNKDFSSEINATNSLLIFSPQSLRLDFNIGKISLGMKSELNSFDCWFFEFPWLLILLIFIFSLNKTRGFLEGLKIAENMSKYSK